jgi:hypothetical protein
MVDIESTGTNFEKNAIIQIAGVKFNYDTGEVSDDFFNRCLRVHPGREWDFATRQWWQKQGDVLATIEARAEDPAAVIADFYQWLLKDWPQGRTGKNEGLQFWSKPSHFDFPFIANYLNLFGYDNPCGFRYARDVNTWIAARSGNPGHPTLEDEMPMEGAKHDALFDCIHQIKVLLAARDRWPHAEVLAA